VCHKKTHQDIKHSPCGPTGFVIAGFLTYHLFDNFSPSFNVSSVVDLELCAQYADVTYDLYECVLVVLDAHIDRCSVCDN